MKPVLILVFLGLTVCCNKDNTESVTESTLITFGIPQKVTIEGYNGEIMEPFLSRDGNLLFFNNLNNPSVNTNLHIANRTDDANFEYIGELKGVNTESLEGIASLDSANNFYFVSTRSYDETNSTIYQGIFQNDSIFDVHLTEGISKNQGGWVNFDAEVSKDGDFLFFADGRFDQNGGPYESNLMIATKINGTFQRMENEKIFENINTSALEYAACISSDMLELYFTNVETPLSESSMPQIYVATRPSVNEPFCKPYKIESISGFAEGPTLSPDDQIVYYHKKENGKFVLYMVCKE